MQIVSIFLISSSLKTIKVVFGFFPILLCVGSQQTGALFCMPKVSTKIGSKRTHLMDSSKQQDKSGFSRNVVERGYRYTTLQKAYTRAKHTERSSTLNKKCSQTDKKTDQYLSLCTVQRLNKLRKP